MTGDQPSTVVLAVCTYRRNEALGRLLDSWLETTVRANVDAGVVVVDDTVEGEAREVAEHFADRFALGVTYAISGKQNISIARNLSLSLSLERADWVAMTDDDCIFDPEWLPIMLAMQRRTGADTVTGPLIAVAPPGAPTWIVDQPFLIVEDPPDGSWIARAATHNSLISAGWLRAHPEHRFLDHLGRIGGEDTVFFRRAHAAGMRIAYSVAGRAYEEVASDRLSYRYQLTRSWWWGNSSYVTSVEGGLASANRMALVGLNQIRKALWRPVRRICSGSSPHLRFALAQTLIGAGMFAGRFGVRVNHH